MNKRQAFAEHRFLSQVSCTGICPLACLLSFSPMDGTKLKRNGTAAAVSRCHRNVVRNQTHRTVCENKFDPVAYCSARGLISVSAQRHADAPRSAERHACHAGAMRHGKHKLRYMASHDLSRWGDTLHGKQIKIILGHNKLDAALKQWITERALSARLKTTSGRRQAHSWVGKLAHNPAPRATRTRRATPKTAGSFSTPGDRRVPLPGSTSVRQRQTPACHDTQSSVSPGLLEQFAGALDLLLGLTTVCARACASNENTRFHSSGTAVAQVRVEEMSFIHSNSPTPSSRRVKLRDSHTW